MSIIIMGWYENNRKELTMEDVSNRSQISGFSLIKIMALEAVDASGFPEVFITS